MVDNITPKPPAPKLSIIKPTRKTVGRVDDLTKRGRRDIITGTDWGAIPGEFAGATDKSSPLQIIRGVKTQFSVPIDLSIEEPDQSYKVLIRGIPQFLAKPQIYYNLVVHLSRFHLLLISGLDYVDDTTANTYAAWVVIEGTEEAKRIFESKDFHVTFSSHKVFNIPRTVVLPQPEVQLFAYQND